MKEKEKRIITKIFLCSIYLITITVLVVCCYHMYKEKQKELPFSDSEKVTDYSYINIYKMSEKFAYYKKSNIGIHYVIDKNENTYLIAINENDYDKYKEIIDYSYNRTDKKPESMRVYGYPVIVSKKLKELSIKNIDKFINKENNEEYLTNNYLDTTIKKKDNFNIVLCVSIMSIIILIVLFFITLFDKGKRTT